MFIGIILFLGLAVGGLFGWTLWQQKQASPLTKRDRYKLLEKQARHGDEEAMYRFAEAFYTEQDLVYFPMIFTWVQKLASRRADPAVWLLLGDMYVSGWGTEEDIKQALHCYEQALTMDIASGRNTDLTTEAHNYLESQIILLRQKISAN